MTTAQYGSLEFAEASQFFRNKLNLPSERWADVWKAQHNSAFTIAGAMETDLLADMRSIVDRSIAEGKSLTWFKSNFKDLVKKHGWDHTGTASWRANIIYSTNVRQAYNAGRYQQLQTFEFWRYKHGDSLSPRPLHAEKDGWILPKDSPFWQVWFPQNGWECKCKVFGETSRSLKRKGLEVRDEPNIDTYEWTDKATGQIHDVPKGIDPGFDYSPGQVDTAKQIKKVADAKPPLAERLPKRMVPSAFSTVKGANINGLNRVLESMAKKRPELNLVAKVIQDNDLKTLFLKPSELPRRNKNIETLRQPITDYLGVPASQAERNWPVPSNMARQAGGYTANAWKHVVIKTKTGLSFAKIKNTDELLNAAEAAIAMHKAGKPAWTVSTIVGKYAESTFHGEAIVTWLHEMGHQMHFLALKKGIDTPGLPTVITRYGGQDTWEWHAEHFVLWALSRKLLFETHPDIAEYFDNMMEKLNE